MRIRSTKPEFWRSERIASVSWDARLVIKGLESYVDDNGVGKDDLALIVADVFPRDLSRNPPGTLQKVSEAITELENAGLLWRYEADGTKLLYISFWESIQRIEKPSRGRFRRPDGTLNYRDSEILLPLPEPSRNTPVALRPRTEEQGNRGTGENTHSVIAEIEPAAQPKKPAADKSAECFEAFWTNYPRKVSKGQARRAWTAAAKKVDPNRLVSAAADFAAKQANTEQRFIPHPASWLNGERWSDETASQPTRQPGQVEWA